MAHSRFVAAAVLSALFAAPASAQSTVQSDCLLQVYFPNGVSRLTAEQQSEVAEFAAEAGGSQFRIIGYASNVGAADSNLTLSKARANRVAVVSRDANTRLQVAKLAGVGEAGDGAVNRRVDVHRDKCALASLPASSAGSVAAGLAPVGAIGAVIAIGGVIAASGGGGGSASQTTGFD